MFLAMYAFSRVSVRTYFKNPVIWNMYAVQPVDTVDTTLSLTNADNLL